ncbi:MAG: hypothetical protein EZS28_030197, partial [Streblomastix strix]
KCDQQVVSELTTIGYVIVLINALSTAGGNEEHDDFNIWLGLNNFIGFIIDLCVGGNFPQFIFSPKYSLAKFAYEQIEEFGGNEELEAQLINEGYKQELFEGDISIKDNALLTKGELLHFFVDQSNQ